MNPEVLEVASMDNDGGRWINHPKDGKKAVTTYININMVDTRPGAFTEFRIVLPRSGAALIKSGERA